MAHPQGRWALRAAVLPAAEGIGLAIGPARQSGDRVGRRADGERYRSRASPSVRRACAPRPRPSNTDSPPPVVHAGELAPAVGFEPTTKRLTVPARGSESVRLRPNSCSVGRSPDGARGRIRPVCYRLCYRPPEIRRPPDARCASHPPSGGLVPEQRHDHADPIQYHETDRQGDQDDAEEPGKSEIERPEPPADEDERDRALAGPSNATRASRAAISVAPGRTRPRRGRRTARRPSRASSRWRRGRRPRHARERRLRSRT